jgi:hypothetical protein
MSSTTSSMRQPCRTSEEWEANVKGHLRTTGMRTCGLCEPRGVIDAAVGYSGANSTFNRQRRECPCAPTLSLVLGGVDKHPAQETSLACVARYRSSMQAAFASLLGV